MARYNFSADELAKRAKVSIELKKKFVAQRAAEAESDSAKGPKKDDKKKVVDTGPRVDVFALAKAQSDRRGFLAGTAMFCGAMGVTAAGIQRFLFPRVLFEPPSQFDAGTIDNFLPMQPVFNKEFRTWIINFGDRIIALSGRCTHLGCTPAWLMADAKFKCPCHGSGFRMNGVNFEGPAPRALERFEIQKQGDRLIVDKAKMFLYEKGQWEDPASYVVV